MTEYILSQQRSPDVERTRVRLLEQFHYPLTARQLDAIGVGEGWRCLDVGAGAGSVTRMLAGRVGASDSVLAVDLDTSLLALGAAGLVDVHAEQITRSPPAHRSPPGCCR